MMQTSSLLHFNGLKQITSQNEICDIFRNSFDFCLILISDFAI